jgi:hypothetical protein
LRNLYAKSKKANRETVDQEFRWLSGVPAIVADNKDPEGMHRVRVIIPSIDPDKIFDEWARQLIPCLGDGYGCFYLPPNNTEVVLFGQLGQKFNLFYMGVYNETHKVPPDFMTDGEQDESISGIRVQGDYKIISECDTHIQAGRMKIETKGSIHLSAGAGVFINNKPF